MKVIILAALILCSSFSCIHRVPLSTAQTIQLNSNQAIGILAESAKSATVLAIALNNSHTISEDLTRGVLQYTRAIADASTASVLIQQSARGNGEKAAAIVQLLSSIKLPSSVRDFVHGPNANAQVISLINLLNFSISNINSLISGG